MKMRIFGLFGLIAGMCSCTENNIMPSDVAVVPLYDDLRGFAVLDSAEQQAVMSRDSVELDAFMAVVGPTPVTADAVSAWSASRAAEVFTPLVDSVFAGVSPAQEYLGYILAAAGKNGLDLGKRRYAEVVYGRPESILFVDSVMLIALNHYLGSDFAGYSHLPSYMRIAKNPQNLPYDIAEALVATSYPYRQQEDATVLSRLLYEGALAHAKEVLVKDSDISLVLGYTSEQFALLEKNEKSLWQALVTKGRLFDTSATTASRLVEPAPVTPGLMPDTPGRAGRYIGYRLVEKYLKNNKSQKDLSFLLSSEFYNNPAILTEISYNP